ncbi:MAG TPA: DEAD/DEAH box helicase [Thermoplasmata archaeon]|nr:DEAD/DEAH box helicase [Thermoplasmata archaeon]
MSTVEHPRIRPGVLEDRTYQAHIASAAIDRNTLVVLPTGLGKTAIALRVIAEALRRAPTQSVLLMAPTRPLVLQHGRSIEDTLLAPAPLVLTGAVAAARRATLFHPPQVIVATPQVVANDLAQGDFPIESLSLIVFDEAHRAVGDYPYVGIGRANLDRAHARVLAMTASPGSQIQTVREVWRNLGLEHVEYRKTEDPDVAPFVHGIGVEPVPVTVPAEVQHLAVRLRTAVRRQTERLTELHRLPSGAVSRRQLLEVGARLQGEIRAARLRQENAGAGVWSAVTAQASAMKGLHALELVETQGVEALRAFLGRQGDLKPSPALRAFLGDPDVVEVVARLRGLDLEHPKVQKTLDIVTEQLHRSPESRAIVFTQYRQTAELLYREFAALADPRIRAARFVGQASHGEDAGMSQREQADKLAEFRTGGINCLVATSVAEEGLDIPNTDLVVFYEPVPDVIRSIQRRGRTGRARAGRVVVLVAEGTRDVGLQRSARGKERRMHEMLEQIELEAQSGTMRAPPPHVVQRSLEEFPGTG